jgi:hypothetical protein
MSIEPGPLLAAIALLGAIAVVMVLPYEQYLLLATLLVYLPYSLQRRLRERIGSRMSAAQLARKGSFPLALSPTFPAVEAAASGSGVVRNLKEA